MAVFAGHYGPEALLDVHGRLQPDVGVVVYEADTDTLASLYEDRTKAVTVANPTTVDALGNLSIYAEPGQYDIAVVAGGVEGDRLHISIGDDADEVIGDAVTLAGVQAVTGAKTFNAGTFYDKGNKVHDVRAYGTLGVGNDYDVAVLAINAANASSVCKTVWFSDLTLDVSQQLPVPGDDLTYAGNNAVIKAADGVDFPTVIADTGRDNFLMSGITVDANQANRAGVATTVLSGAIFTGFTNSRVEKCKVKNTIGYVGASAAGIAFGGISSDCHIADCDAINCGDFGGDGSDGFYISGGSRNSITNVRGYNVADTVAVLEGTSVSRIDGVTGFTVGALIGITALGAADATGNSADNLTAYDWRATVSGAINIRATGSGYLYETRIGQLTLLNLTGTGPSINVAKPSTGLVVGLTIDAPRIKGAGTQGILLTGAHDVTIGDYDIEDCTGHPIQADSCINIDILPGRVDAAGTPGIVFVNCDGAQVKDPTVTGTPTYPVYLYGTNTNVRIKLSPVGTVSQQEIGADAGNTPLVELEGSGTPEGTIPAAVGSTYRRSNGGTGTTLYVKESAPTPTTGWIAVGGSEATHLVGAVGEPAFANSWANLGGAYQTAGFYKDVTGRVHLRGVVTGGTVNTAMFVVPAGYRPALNLIMAVRDGAGALQRFNVQTNGNVSMEAGNNAFVGIDGISWRAEA